MSVRYYSHAVPGQDPARGSFTPSKRKRPRVMRKGKTARKRGRRRR